MFECISLFSVVFVCSTSARAYEIYGIVWLRTRCIIFVESVAINSIIPLDTFTSFDWQSQSERVRMKLFGLSERREREMGRRETPSDGREKVSQLKMFTHFSLSQSDHVSF